MCRSIIFNNMGYIHSINTFLRQKVSAHKRHIILAFFLTLFEKTPKYIKKFVCTYFLSQKCVYWVYITNIIEYNVSTHLRHTFIASHNQKMGYFWKLCLFRAKIVNFEYPLWTFLVCDMSVCPLYMSTIYIWPTQKWLQWTPPPPADCRIWAGLRTGARVLEKNATLTKTHKWNLFLFWGKKTKIKNIEFWSYFFNLNPKQFHYHQYQNAKNTVLIYQYYKLQQKLQRMYHFILFRKMTEVFKIFFPCFFDYESDFSKRNL